MRTLLLKGILFPAKLFKRADLNIFPKKFLQAFLSELFPGFLAVTILLFLLEGLPGFHEEFFPEFLPEFNTEFL